MDDVENGFLSIGSSIAALRAAIKLVEVGEVLIPDEGRFQGRHYRLCTGVNSGGYRGGRFPGASYR